MASKNRNHMVEDATDGGPPSDAKYLSRQQFGQRLETFLAKKGWRQAQLAREAGLPKDSISTYIRGVTMPTHHSLLKLCAALGVTQDELLPNQSINAIADDFPEFDLKVSPANPDKAWLRVNRLVSFSVGVKVAELLQRDGRPAADDDADRG